MTGPAKTQKAVAAYAVLSAVFFALVPSASAATLIGVSSVSAIQEGETVPIEWYLDTEGETVNAVELGLTFSSETLSLTAEPGRSLIPLWVRSPSVHRELGIVTLVGGAPGGLTGVVPLFRTNVRGMTEGLAVFSLTDDSRVYLHDGAGTPRTVTLPQFQLAVVEARQPSITSKTHSDQNAWYRTTEAKFAFPYNAGKKYSYTFTSDFNRFPGNEPQETTGAVSYENLPDGVHYFRLAEISSDTEVQDKGVYRIQIDTTPPESFVPLVATSTDLWGGKPFLSFASIDKTSGVRSYEVKKGHLGFSKAASSPHPLSRPLVGDSIRIRAYDAAGNYTDAVVSYPGYISAPLFYALLVLFGAAVGTYAVYSRRKALL